MVYWGPNPKHRVGPGGGPWLRWCWSLGLGLLLILNDKLVSRIQLANVDLSMNNFQVSLGFIEKSLNFYRIFHILIFSEGISYLPDSISSVIVGTELLALSQHRSVQI